MSKHSNELQPNTASFEDTYAWILFKQKKYADARVMDGKSAGNMIKTIAQYNLNIMATLCFTLAIAMRQSRTGKRQRNTAAIRRF